MAAVSAVLLLHLGRGTSFFYDDWWFVTGRMDWTPRVFLEPHSGHLSVLPILVYKVVLETGGLGAYWVLRVILTLLVVLCGWLVFVYARWRVDAWIAVTIATPFLVFGAAYPDVLWPFQIGFLGSIAAGLGALVALDQERWRLACGLVTASLLCSGVGVALALAALIDQPRRWWIASAPLLGWVAWWVAFQNTSAKSSNVTAVPHWIVQSAIASLDALVGAPEVVGALLATGLLAAALYHRSRRSLALLAAVCAFWAMAAYARADVAVPWEPRYLYPGALLLTLAGVEVLRGRWRLVLVSFGVVAALLNTVRLTQNAERVRGWTETRQLGKGAGYPDNFWAGYREAERRYGE